jgi:hypothetical protein
MRKFRIPALWIALAAGCAVDLHAQSEKLIVIEHADSLLGRTIDGEQAQELIGAVRFSQDRVRVECDRAIQFKSSGNVQLLGNVTVYDDSLTMKFPRGMYYRGERRAVALDSVRLDDGKTVLTARFGEYHIDPKKAFFKTQVVATDRESQLRADSLTYYRTEQLTNAFGKVEVESFADNLKIRGRRFESFKKGEYTRMTERPVLVKVDTTSLAQIDTLVVRSNVMESYRLDTLRKLIATDSVEIVRSEMAAVAGLAVFFTDGDSIHLRKSPVVWYQQTQVSGDSIDVYLKQRKLDRVRVLGNAFAISQSDSLNKEKFDQLTGEEMLMRFGEKGLERMDVISRAISVYHLYEDTTANGLNKISGDHIVMVWENKKLVSLKVYGGIEGQYFPENLTTGKEKEFALAGFNWRGDRPQMRASDFSFINPSKNDSKKK